MATAPTLLEPPHTSTDLFVDGGVEDGMGSASVSFLNRQVAAVEMASGSTDAEAKLMLEGIFATRSALHTVYSWNPP